MSSNEKGDCYERLNKLYSSDYLTNSNNDNKDNQKSELIKMINDFHKCYDNIKNHDAGKAIHYRVDYRGFIYENIDLYNEIKSECASEETLKDYCSNYNKSKISYVQEDNEYFEKREKLKAIIEESRKRARYAHPESLRNTFDSFSDDDTGTNIRPTIMATCATISIFGIFYLFKLSPFGSYFNSFFRRKKKMGKNIGDVNNLPFSPMPMNGLINYDRNSYNLLHHSE